MDRLISNRAAALIRMRRRAWFLRAWDSVKVLFGAAVGTVICFLILPALQAIAGQKDDTYEVREASAAVEAPPPPPEPEEEEEPEPEDEPPPELSEESQPLDLQALELALNPGAGTGWGTGEFTMKLTGLGGGKGGSSAFSVNDLDQPARPKRKVKPVLTARQEKARPATVVVMFIVSATGAVTNARIKESSNPILNPAVLNAIKGWKFEPGRRNGQPVESRGIQDFRF